MDQMIRPLMSNLAVIGLFFIPIITMRLFAEEKRTGTFELLATSPVTDMEIILGKWLAAVALYAAMLGISLISMATLFAYGKPDWRPMIVGYLGLLLQGGCLLAIGHIHFLVHAEPDCGGGGYVQRATDAVGD